MNTAMKLVEESRSFAISLKKYNQREDIDKMIVYYTWVKQICENCPVSKEKVFLLYVD